MKTKTMFSLASAILLGVAASIGVTGCDPEKRCSHCLDQETDSLAAMTIEQKAEWIAASSLVEVAARKNVIEVDTFYGRHLIQSASGAIKLNNVGITPLAQVISSAGLDDFKELINELPNCSGCASSVGGMQIKYGQSGNNLVLYYRPLRFCKTAGSCGGPGTSNMCYYDICKVGVYHTYSPDEFTPAVSADFGSDTVLYRTPGTASPHGMRIKRDGATLADFVDDTDADGDIKSLIYPMKQLESIVGVSGSLRLWNVASSYRDVGFKHNLIISSGNVTISNNWLTIPENARFSNMSHICPPRCAATGFLLEQ